MILPKKASLLAALAVVAVIATPSFSAIRKPQVAWTVNFTDPVLWMGLIGDKLYSEKYSGDFQSTPIFVGTSNPDPHVPVDRVTESVMILKKMNASVTEKIYQNMGHTVSEDEIDKANQLVFST